MTMNSTSFAGFVATLRSIAAISLGLAGGLVGSASAETGSGFEAFAGSWTCEGSRFLKEGAQPFQATYEFREVAGGAWLQTHYKEIATEQNPMPLEVMEFWGRDIPSGRYRNYWVNNFSMSGTFETEGWSGEMFAWATDAFPLGGSSAPMQATFRLLGADRFEVKPAIGVGSDDWQPMAEFSCNR